MNFKQNIGSQIKALRIAAGLNQSGLASRLGVSKQYVSGVENGKEVLSLEQIEKFATALGATVEISLQNSNLAKAAALLAEQFEKFPTAEEIGQRAMEMTLKKKKNGK